MLAANAFFVGAEFGLVSSRRSNIEVEALKGSRAAKITLGAMERVSLMLAAAQLGITFSSLIFGAIGEPLLAHYLEIPFEHIGIPGALLHPISFAIALTLMTYVHVVLGEMVPKNLALAGPTKAALWLTPPLVVFVKITLPIVHFLNGIANIIVRMLGVTPQPEVASSFSRDEVAGFVRESHKEGLISKDESQLLSGALTFEHKTVERVLLKPEKIVSVSDQATPEDIENLTARTSYSRFPVTNNAGVMQGYVHIKDLLTISPAKQHSRLAGKVVRDMPHFSATTSLRDALFAMQKQGAHLACVTGENQEFLGVIMLEDMLEELVGRIKDDA